MKGGGGGVLALQRREQYECRVKEGVWGAFHSAAQTQKKDKKKRLCSENPDSRRS